MMTENGGIFVCRTRHLVLAGGSKVSICSSSNISVHSNAYFVHIDITS